MLDWIKRRIGTPYPRPEPDAVPPKPQGRAMAGKYILLYKYLENRYASTVVLTFGQIEDLLGFSLPDQARQEPKWWTEGTATATGPSYSDAWILASRSAKPNLIAHTVTFERAV